mgnify:CR=1 FL=1
MDNGCPKCAKYEGLCPQCQIDYLDAEIATDMRLIEQLKAQLKGEQNELDGKR